MLRVRSEQSKKNKYWISRHRYFQLYHWCLQYPEWKDKCVCIENGGLTGVQYSDMPKGTTIGNPTERMGIELSEYTEKIKLLEGVAKEADEELAPYIITSVTQEYASYNYLESLNMPCSKNTFFDRRRKFFWLLSEKLR